MQNYTSGFLGTNSPKGFHSYFDELYNRKIYKNLYILKGGPGTGKSTFMKKIGNYYKEKGNQVNFIFCSSDPHSLDAIFLPEIGTCFVDGTAPHVLEPNFPIAVHSIINLGDFVDETKVKPHTEEIVKVTTDVSAFFSECYRYLKGAQSLILDNDTIIAPATNFERIDALAALIIKKEFKPLDKLGTQKKCFLTAITPLGVLENYDLAGYKIYFIKDTYCIAHHLLAKIRDFAVQNGYDVTSCFNPFYPDEKIKELVFKDEKIAFISSEKEFSPSTSIFRQINLDRFVSKDVIRMRKNRFTFNKKLSADLIQKGCNSVKSAKLLHDVLENYYVSAMDFKKCDELCAQTIEKLDKMF